MSSPPGDAGAARGLDDHQALGPDPAGTSAWLSSQSASAYAIELVAIGLAYFAVAKVGLAMASINPSATPIWPSTGLALAAVMLRGYRVWPAIFLAAWLANATTAGSVFTSSAIALGNTLESLVGGYLISRWSGGLRTFDTPAGVARFALTALVAATPISATIGVGSLTVAGFAEPSRAVATWMTWWLGDLAGALVITPVIVLWAQKGLRSQPRKDRLESGAVIAAAVVVGIIAFSPLIEQTPSRDPLGFLAVLPLMWAALRRGQRDTATVALVLSTFALWGAMSGEGPFVRSNINDALLLLIMYMISTSVPTLALSADVAVHWQTERTLREAQTELDRIVQERTAALQETREALHQAQKMEALGQLTGGVAHDFNNVLTAIINSLEPVRGSTDPKTRKRLDRALQAARNGAALVQQMLVFARRGPLRVEATDINKIVVSAMRMFARTCPETIEVRTGLAPDLHWATADPTQMQTAILNLAVNARDAMPSGGKLMIRTENTPPAERTRLPPGDYITVTVADTGEGMSPDVLARAFEPFFTTKESGRGTGLGLSMVYSTLRRMGGDVGIESRPNDGTIVRLTLPAAAPPPSDVLPVAERVPAADPSETASTGLLYVEDDALVSSATVDLLEEAGYAVHPAADARHALDLLDQHPDIDLIVTDIGLPGMDGHELAAEARRRRPALGVVFLTGYDWSGKFDDPADLRTKRLAKPYLDSELFETLASLAKSGKDEDR